MRRRWYYWRRMLHGNRLMRNLVLMGVVVAVVWSIWGLRGYLALGLRYMFEEYGVLAAEKAMEAWLPVQEKERGLWRWNSKTEVFSYLADMEEAVEASEDPAYERLLAAEWERKKRSGNDLWEGLTEAERQLKIMEENAGRQNIGAGQIGTETMDAQNAWNTDQEITGEVIALKPTGSSIIREKLADYDYLMQNFYSVHPTTTAGRDMMQVETFLSMDLSIEKNEDAPQILIYHTHSQEEYADYLENQNATIVGVGARLAKLLEQAGYQVIHDATVYDMKDGKLDRSQAYTYALEGINGILQKYPTIKVVLDLHRDGVDEKTKLVTEVNGIPTAKIMFFHGTSQTPDGPIEYLPNPNRTANMAFSFQMQLLATEQYPGLTRKIYLKGLRYNQHVRARTALVEVGAQTNTYAEALNAMEPLADLLCQVLNGES